MRPERHGPFGFGGRLRAASSAVPDCWPLKNGIEPGQLQSLTVGGVRGQSDKGDMRQQGVRADQGGEAEGVHIRQARRAHDDFFQIGNVGGKKAGHLTAGSDGCPLRAGFSGPRRLGIPLRQEEGRKERGGLAASFCAV